VVEGCQQYLCEPKNPCDKNPCEKHQRCVMVTPKCELASCPRYKCFGKGSSSVTTCHSIFEDSNKQAKSGVYILTDSDGTAFHAYCDMSVHGGGWMLAFKQSDFGSGHAKPSAKARGAKELLSPEFDSTSHGSLLEYGNPTRFLFTTSVPTNWFTTRGLIVYQDTYYSRIPKLCLYSVPNTDSGAVVSKEWDNSQFKIWDTFNIELMQVTRPEISAITVGTPVKEQHRPQCWMPHCSSDRHGRYQGACQNSTVGEGNWLIFTKP